MQYMVQENETVNDVARKTRTDPGKIIAMNYLTDDNPIRSGDLIEIPESIAGGTVPPDFGSRFPKMGGQPAGRDYVSPNRNLYKIT